RTRLLLRPQALADTTFPALVRGAWGILLDLPGSLVSERRGSQALCTRRRGEPLCHAARGRGLCDDFRALARPPERLAEALGKQAARVSQARIRTARRRR